MVYGANLLLVLIVLFYQQYAEKNVIFPIFHHLNAYFSATSESVGKVKDEYLKENMRQILLSPLILVIGPPPFF